MNDDRYYAAILSLIHDVRNVIHAEGSERLQRAFHQGLEQRAKALEWETLDRQRSLIYGRHIPAEAR